MEMSWVSALVPGAVVSDWERAEKMKEEQIREEINAT
jgi:hypothetical protein